MSTPSRQLIAALVVAFVAVGLLAGAFGAALGGARVANAPATSSDLLNLLAGGREPAAPVGVSAAVTASDKSVVRLIAHGAKRGDGPLLATEVLGAGAMFTTDGWILTYRDAVLPGGKVTAMDAVIGNVRYVVEKVVVDPFTQVAFVKVAGDRFPVMSLVKESKLAVGDTAYVFDATLGLVPATVAAIGLMPSAEVATTERSGLVYQFTVPTTVVVGSPMIGADGSAVGVVSAMHDGEVVMVPLAAVSRAADSALVGKVPSQPFFGVKYRDLETMVVETTKTRDEQGALVVAVVPQSPAEKAGLRADDVIVAVNGEAPTVRAPLSDIVARYASGATLTVDYRRAGVAKTTTLTLTSL